MNVTKIQWTDFTANPVRYRDQDGKPVWACVKVSDGCKNCYAEALAKRYGRGGPFTVGQTAKVTPYLDDKELNAMLRSPRLVGKRVFVGDMTDVFGEWVTDEMLDRMFAVFALRPDVTWQVLTKRPARMREYVADMGRHYAAEVDGEYMERWGDAAVELTGDPCSAGGPIEDCGWPLPNVWLGTSVEDQAAADSRIPHLLATPAAVRFLSCEPLLGPVDFEDEWLLVTPEWQDPSECPDEVCRCEPPSTLDWVIVGGESGGGARPMDLAWARSLVAQCRAADVAVFVKQLGSRALSLAEQDDELPRRADRREQLALRHSHGGDMEEWPEDLQVREFPGVGVAS